VTFEVLNGTGIHGANVFREFDDDPYKNVMLRVSQEVARPSGWAPSASSARSGLTRS